MIQGILGHNPANKMWCWNCKINASPLADMDMGKFFTWLDEHKKNLAMDQKSNDVY